MLLHPPVVFLGYAGCTIPFALAIAALLSGRLDAAWIRDARPWAFFAWAVQGIGILVGAYWAYEELGWGGYWSWDPVENGSLIPWLTATAMIHAAMVYRQRGGLKRTTIVLAVATFAACNFAAFLTRSGIFSSLHAFSQSPIGWMFLLLIAALVVAAAVPLVRRRVAMTARQPGFRPVGQGGRCHRVGLRVDPPGGGGVHRHGELARVASLLSAQSPRWRRLLQRRADSDGLAVAGGDGRGAAAALGRAAGSEASRRRSCLRQCAGVMAAGLAWLGGLRHPLAMAVVGLAVMAAIAVAASWVLDARRQQPRRSLVGAGFCLLALRNRRRTYAGYVMHLGLACLAVGVAGSSLGTQQHEATLSKGESIAWAGRNIRFVGVLQHRLPAETRRASRVGSDRRRGRTLHVAAGTGILLPPKRSGARKSPSTRRGAATSTRFSTAARGRTGFSLPLSRIR